MPTNLQDCRNRPLKVCLLSYRSNPHSGGQGVYIKNLSRALADLGHRVEVVSGPPELRLDADIPVHRLPSLDLYDPADPFRTPSLKELRQPLNLLEWLGVSTMGFPEPFLFGIRASRFLMPRLRHYDVIHDNQCLSYGTWALGQRMPVVATIHHPLSMDRRIAINSNPSCWHKLKQWRWFSFIGMQKRVAQSLAHLITVSECARRDISRDFRIPAACLTVVPNGVRGEDFHPLPAVVREKSRIIVTNSADIPLKGLPFLLRAVSKLTATHAPHLVIVGKLKPNGRVARLIADLDLARRITFTGRIDPPAFAREYARASVAVVPSVYEGFGLPAAEAMACGVPVISTTGGALPEVVGDAGILVPPGDTPALVKALAFVLDYPAAARALGEAGCRRVRKLFNWEKTARLTAAVYREAIDDHGRF
ncbi:MAG: glycosyltransferase family 4 protein [Desulfobacterales bacterium]